MSAKIITLSAKDQDLLRVALSRAEEWHDMAKDLCCLTPQQAAFTERIKELKERLV